MDGGDGFADGVKEQNRRAVSGERDQRDARFIGDLRVADLGLLAQETFAPVFPADTAHDVRVTLLGEHRLLRLKADGGAENAVVFQHVFRLVAAMRAEIEACEAALTHAAEARGEAVDASRQRIGSQIFQSSLFDGVKHNAPCLPGWALRERAQLQL